MGMNEDTEFEEVVARLRRLGERAVDPAVASAHLQMMAAATPSTDGGWWRRFNSGFSGKMRVGIGIVVASVAGGTGLAFAGGLPSGAQHVAHSAFSAVGINVPEGSSSKGACVSAPGASAANGCGAGTVRERKPSSKSGPKTGSTADDQGTTTLLRVDSTPPAGAVVEGAGVSSSVDVATTTGPATGTTTTLEAEVATTSGPETSGNGQGTANRPTTIGSTNGNGNGVGRGNATVSTTTTVATSTTVTTVRGNSGNGNNGNGNGNGNSGTVTTVNGNGNANGRTTTSTVVVPTTTTTSTSTPGRGNAHTNTTTTPTAPTTTNPAVTTTVTSDTGGAVTATPSGGGLKVIGAVPATLTTAPTTTTLDPEAAKKQAKADKTAAELAKKQAEADKKAAEAQAKLNRD